MNFYPIWHLWIVQHKVTRSRCINDAEFHLPAILIIWKQQRNSDGDILVRDAIRPRIGIALLRLLENQIAKKMLL